MRRLLFVISLLSLTSCTFHRPLQISSASIGPGAETVTGMVEGKATATTFLFFGPWGDDSYAAAVKDALRNSNAHSLVNVFADEKCFAFPFLFLPLYSECTTSVLGTAVRYGNVTATNLTDSLRPLPTRVLDLDMRAWTSIPLDTPILVNTVDGHKFEGRMQGVDSSYLWIQTPQGRKAIANKDISEIKQTQEQAPPSSPK